jgi:hypothetical protein
MEQTPRTPNGPDPADTPDRAPDKADSQEALSASLRSSLRSRADAAALRDAVCAYVDAARQRGEAVEHVIIELKQEMRAAGVVDRYANKDERMLAESVIRWCIERYYGPALRGD